MGAKVRLGTIGISGMVLLQELVLCCHIVVAFGISEAFIGSSGA